MEFGVDLARIHDRIEKHDAAGENLYNVIGRGSPEGGRQPNRAPCVRTGSLGSPSTRAYSAVSAFLV